MKSHRLLPFTLTAALLAALPVLAADKPAAKPKAPAAKPAAAPEAGAAADAKPVVIPDPVATVNGDAIKKADLEAAFNNFLASKNIPAATIPPEQRLQGYHMMLDDLIIEKLITKKAADTKVTDEEVTAQFDRIKSNFGSEAELKKQIEAAGETIEKVKDGMRERLRQEKWVNEQVKDKGTVTDEDAADFYKKNPEQFKQPEQVRASHILISVPEDAKPEVVAEKEKAAKAIAERVKKGEPFDKLAKELSEDPSAKENSGDLDFFTREAMVPEFSTAAFGMKKDEISDPVKSKFGFHIIKVTDRKDAETITLDKVKPQLLAYLQKQKKQEEVMKIVKDMREKADVKINLPAPALPALAPAPAPAP